jgi:hypothetical protein
VGAERNGKFVARIATQDEDDMKRTRWVPLTGAVTVSQAREQLKTLQADRTRNEFPMLKRTPKFADYAAQHLAYYGEGRKASGELRPSFA